MPAKPSEAGRSARPFARAIGALARFAACAAIGCGGAAMAQDAPALPRGSPQPTLAVDGEALSYTGLLNKAGLAQLRDVLRAHPGVRTLRVDSSGGDALPALEIGRLVRARRLHVVVEGRCNSACANYVFVPAARRTIRPGAMVMWHNSCPQNVPPGTRFSDVLAGRVPGLAGDARPKGEADRGKTVDDLLADKRALRKVDRDMRDYFPEWAAAHQAFFREVPVDARIVCLGDYLALPRGKGHAYTLSAGDMARFGVCGVEAPPTYTRDVVEALAREGKTSLGGPVRLADYPEFEPRPPAGACDAAAASRPAPNRD